MMSLLLSSLRQEIHTLEFSHSLIHNVVDKDHIDDSDVIKEEFNVDEFHFIDIERIGNSDVTTDEDDVETSDVKNEKYNAVDFCLKEEKESDGFNFTTKEHDVDYYDWVKDEIDEEYDDHI